MGYNVNVPLFNVEEHLQRITVELPYKEGTFEDLSEKVVNSIELIKDKKDLIIKALRARANACAKAYAKACLDDRYMFSCGSCHYYKRNGVVRHYSEVAMTAMMSTIEDLENENYTFVLGSGQRMIQILKALVWVPENERQTPNEKFRFQDLVDYLVEELVYAE